MSVCSNNNFKALVLQFMPNGSLDQWLHQRSMPCEEERGPDMRLRLEIAQDVASAMEYLHHDFETPAVHCDLKPSNFLLDENKSANVGDFGLIMILLNNPKKRPFSSTLELKGSIGYIAPEYGMGEVCQLKGVFRVWDTGDVYKEETHGRVVYWRFGSAEIVSMELPDRVIDIVDRELLKK